MDASRIYPACFRMRGLGATRDGGDRTFATRRARRPSGNDETCCPEVECPERTVRGVNSFSIEPSHQPVQKAAEAHRLTFSVLRKSVLSRAPLHTSQKDSPLVDGNYWGIVEGFVMTSVHRIRVGGDRGAHTRIYTHSAKTQTAAMNVSNALVAHPHELIPYETVMVVLQQREYLPGRIPAVSQ